MNRNWTIPITLGILLLLCFAFLQSCSKEAAQCPLCSRDIHQGMQVKITHNSIPLHTCCMACALTYQAQTKNVEILDATDFLSNKAIPARSAFYIVDSDISPCIQDPKVQKFIREPHSAIHECYDRCSPGILAFEKQSDAQAFEKEHGGEIYRFAELTMVIPVKGGHHHD
jgi:nitrous oxide reductase accessory protein NosL